MTPAGFPHSTSSDRRLLDSFPRLFAVTSFIASSAKASTVNFSSLEYRESKTFCARYAVLKLPEGARPRRYEIVPAVNSFSTEQCAPSSPAPWSSSSEPRVAESD